MTDLSDAEHERERTEYRAERAEARERALRTKLNSAANRLIEHDLEYDLDLEVHSEHCAGHVHGLLCDCGAEARKLTASPQSDHDKREASGVPSQRWSYRSDSPDGQERALRRIRAWASHYKDEARSQQRNTMKLIFDEADAALGVQEDRMSEPRRWTLGWNPQGGHLTADGPPLANPDDYPAGGLLVREDRVTKADIEAGAKWLGMGEIDDRDRRQAREFLSLIFKEEASRGGI